MTTRNKDGPPDDPRPPAPPADAPPPRPPAGPLPAAQVLGQMLIPELRPAEQLKNAERMEEVRALVRDHGVGGFLLSGGDLFEMPPLLNALQHLSPIPLLIAADFENGTGQMIRGGTHFPTNLAVGATRSEELARLKGLITALEARALGVHLNLAPVADLQRNPDNATVNARAFGEDPALVARLATAFHLGCREKGLLTCAKHFPGHGDASADAPLSLPALRADRELLRTRELVPFAELFRTGVDAVMTAHVLVEDVDRRYPASLSPVVINDLLRREMGFAGVVLTDAMSVGGLSASFPPEEALVLAAAAGNDALLHPGRPDAALAALEGAVRSGRLSEAALRASAQRLLDLKQRVGLRPGAPVRPELVERLVGTREHLAAAQRVADASVTLVKDATGIVPVSPRRFGPLFEIRIVDDSSTGNLEVFGEEMRRRFGVMTTLRVAPGQDTTPILLRLRDMAKAKPKTALVIGVFSRQSPRRGAAVLDPALAAFVQAATRAVPNAAVISFGNPYLLRQIPDVPAYVCGYSDCEATQRAVARVLCNELPAAGKLPISLTADYQVGHGLAVPK